MEEEKKEYKILPSLISNEEAREKIKIEKANNLEIYLTIACFAFLILFFISFGLLAKIVMYIVAAIGILCGIITLIVATRKDQKIIYYQCIIETNDKYNEFLEKGNNEIQAEKLTLDWLSMIADGTSNKAPVCKKILKFIANNHGYDVDF